MTMSAYLLALFTVVTLSAAEIDNKLQIMNVAVSTLKSDTSIRNKIKSTLNLLTKTKDLNIFAEPTEDQCIVLLQETGLIELVYSGIVKQYSTYDPELMITMINIIGKQLCTEEAKLYKQTENAFHALTEHVQNEIVEMILQEGNDRNAWIAPLYIDCVNLMSDAVDMIDLKLHKHYKQLTKLKKLLTIIAQSTCASYFVDKRDL
eukprot:397653_1